MSADVLFYHLEHHPLERVLPSLLEKTLERGWRAVVQAGSDERVEALDNHLWSYREDSFLPHGSVNDGHVAMQPVFLTADVANPNGAQVRFIVDGADCAEFTGYTRIVVMFDGRDEEALGKARAQWKLARDQGCAVTYWQQSRDGRWEKKA